MTDTIEGGSFTGILETPGAPKPEVYQPVYLGNLAQQKSPPAMMFAATCRIIVFHLLTPHRPPGSTERDVTQAVAMLVNSIHGRNVAAGWWTDLDTGKPKDRNMGELLMLTASEVAEGAIGHFSNLMDDKLPHRGMLEVELGDAAIRAFDLAGGKNAGLPEELTALIYDPATLPALEAESFAISDMLLRVFVDIRSTMEAHRKGRPFGRHLAWVILRLFWIGYVAGLDVPEALEEKLAFNAVRPDHKADARRQVDGKKY